MRKPVTSIQFPGRSDDIVRTLFPPAIPGTVPVDIVTFKSFPAITVEEVRSTTRALPNGKALGPVGIPNEIVKAAALYDPQRFANVFNACLANAHYPASWKKANFVLLPKPGKSPDDHSVYLPLCMLDTSGKLLEKVLVQRLWDSLGDGGLSPNQYGFRPGRSLSTRCHECGSWWK